MGFDKFPDKIHRREFLKIASLTAGAILLGDTPDVFALSSKRISVASGGMGSVYFVVGGGIASAITKYSGLEAVAEITAGSANNCELVGSKKSDLGLVMADTAYNAFRGTGTFEGNPLPIRILTVLYPSYTHIVTLENKGISKINDLIGKSVAIGIKGSETQITAFRLLEAAGFNPDNGIKKINMAASESSRALRDGTIDAYFWVGGIPSASLHDLAKTPGLTISLISHGNLIPLINAKYGPVYYESAISKQVYPGMAHDAIVCAIPNVIICHRDMDTQSAYNAVQIIFKHLSEISSVHPQARKISLKTGASLNSMWYHPGAEKFFREQGFTVPAQ